MNRTSPAGSVPGRSDLKIEKKTAARDVGYLTGST
jgi:hypothetical protein